MRKEQSRFWILLLFVFLNCIDKSTAQTISLEQYLNLVSKQNLSLKQSKLQIDLAEEDRKMSRSSLLPQIHADANYQRDFNDTYMYIDEEGDMFGSKFKSNFNNQINANAVAEQVLFAPIEMANYKISLLSKKLAELNHELSESELLYHANKLYWQALYSKEAVKVLTKNQQIAHNQWKHNQKLYDQGFISRIQNLQSEIHYKQSLPLLSSAKNGYESLLNEMKMLAQLPLDRHLEPEGNLESLFTKNLSAQNPSLDLSNNQELQVLDQQVSIIKQQARANELYWMPRLKTTFGYNFNTMSNQFQIENTNNLLFAQLGIQMPIFTGGFNTSKLQKSKIELNRTELEMFEKQSQLETRLRNAKLTLETSLQKIEEEKEIIKLSNEEVLIAEKSLEQGTLTAIEFKEIRLSLTQARLRLLNSYLDYNTTILDIERILNQ